jgi:hypothetical protein
MACGSAAPVSIPFDGSVGFCTTTNYQHHHLDRGQRIGISGSTEWQESSIKLRHRPVHVASSTGIPTVPHPGGDQCTLNYTHYRTRRSTLITTYDDHHASWTNALPMLGLMGKGRNTAHIALFKRRMW